MGNLRFLGNFIIFYFIGFNLYFWLRKRTCSHYSQSGETNKRTTGNLKVESQHDNHGQQKNEEIYNYLDNFICSDIYSKGSVDPG